MILFLGFSIKPRNISCSITNFGRMDWNGSSDPIWNVPRPIGHLPTRWSHPSFRTVDTLINHIQGVPPGREHPNAVQFSWIQVNWTLEFNSRETVENPSIWRECVGAQIFMLIVRSRRRCSDLIPNSHSMVIAFSISYD
jgi:hypothetical protein